MNYRKFLYQLIRSLVIAESVFPSLNGESVCLYHQRFINQN